MSPEELEALVARHPGVRSLAERAPELDLPSVALALVRQLVGGADGSDATDGEAEAPELVRGLFRVAPGDLAVLAMVCRGRPLAALSAAAAVLEVVVTAAEALRDDASEGGGPRGGEPEASRTAVRPAPDATKLWRGAAGQAVASAELATRVQETLGMLMPGHGWDTGSSVAERVLLDRLHDLERLMARMPEIEAIARTLGRLESTSRTSRRAEGGGRQTVVGVRVGGELEDVLPCELALLGEAGTEDLFYMRFAERRLLALQMRSDHMEESAAGRTRGPIVACVDTSASMRGLPEVAAKALILAIARRVMPQGRPVHLMLFGGRGNCLEMELRGGRSGLDGLVDFLLMSFHSGTDFDGPLLRAMELVRHPPWSRADVLVVTDGLCRATSSVVRTVAERRAEVGFELTSVVIVGHHGADPSGVTAFSDHVFTLRPERPDDGPLRWASRPVSARTGATRSSASRG